MRTLFATAVLFTALGLTPGMAQVPVIDNANLAKAQQIATDTKSILTADQQIMQFTHKTLQAVTGDRTSQAQGSLAQMALAWVLRDDRITSALIGARSVEQLDNSLDALVNPDLSPDELDAIDAALA